MLKQNRSFRTRMSDKYSQQQNDCEATVAASMVASCLEGDSQDSMKNDIDVNYGSVELGHIGGYGGESADSQQVISLEAHNWGQEDGLQGGVMKQYAQSPNVSGRMMTDRERLQLHNQLSWEEASKQDVIIVRCRDMTAELHKARLGSGSKGKCIKMNDIWMTPSEFEAMAGRGSSKDWKRSVRFGGHTLQKLIEEGILAPHAIACTCSICCGDTTLTGPVRLFTPYKRRRKDGNDDPRGDGRRSSSRGDQSSLYLLSQNGIPVSDPSSYLLGSLSMYGGNTSSSRVANSSNRESDGSINTIPAYSQLEDVVNALVVTSQQLKLMLDQVRLQYDAVRDAAVNQVRVQAEMEKREALSQQKADIISMLKRIVGVDQEVLLQQISTQLQVEPTHAKVSCANCGRDAYLECTACRRACYCSTYCQQRDWPLHQHQCALVQNPDGIVPDTSIQVEDSSALHQPRESNMNEA